MNKRGFTLVELLVAISIMGIIMIIAIPSVNNLITKNKEKKYEAYARSLERAAKLYVDENEKEVFGLLNGCSIIEYDRLKQVNLVKDFPDNKINCNSSNTFVRAIKLNNEYKYEASLYCVDDKGDKKYDHVLDRDCSLVKDETGPNLKVTVTPSANPNWIKPKDISSVVIELNDGEGLGFEYNKKIKYQWVKGTGDPDTSKWKTLYMGNDALDKQITTTLPKSSIPTNVEGEYYLWFEESSIKDILGNLANTNKAGPYKFDDVAPNCDITVSGTKGQNNWYTSNVNLTLTKGDASVSNYGLLVSSNSSEDVSYNSKTTDSINYETKGVYAHAFVKDAVGNVCSKTKSIKVDKSGPVITVAAKNTSKSWYPDKIMNSNYSIDSGGFFAISSRAWRYVRGAECSDSISGIKTNSFSTDLYADGYYREWQNVDNDNLYYTDALQYPYKPSPPRATNFLAYRYLASGVKKTWFQCTNNAGKTGSKCLGTIDCSCRSIGTNKYKKGKTTTTYYNGNVVINSSKNCHDPRPKFYGKGCDCDIDHPDLMGEHKSGDGTYMFCYLKSWSCD